MNGKRDASREAGFTLVEVLLALAIFGVIAVLAYRATAALTEGEARLAAEARRWRTLEALFTRFEADIRQAVPRGSRVGARVEPAWLALPADGAGNAALVFTRAGAEFADDPGLAGQRIGYRLRGHAVEIAYWPRLDNAADVQPAVYTLADGVSGFRVAYLGRAGAWRDNWPVPGEPALPRAVRVNLTLDSGEAIERWFALR
jgi:general secretion pathway protein J